MPGSRRGISIRASGRATRRIGGATRSGLRPRAGDGVERAAALDRVEPRRAARGRVGRRGARSLPADAARRCAQRGIEPMVTLHHFTDPLWFDERGAVLADPDAIVPRFRATRRGWWMRCGDLCDLWCTINEPNVYALSATCSACSRPGRRATFARRCACKRRWRAATRRPIERSTRVQPGARVGWAQNYNLFDPARPGSRLDRMMASFSIRRGTMCFRARCGRGARRRCSARSRGVCAGCAGRATIVGFNVYYRDLVRFDVTRSR